MIHPLIGMPQGAEWFIILGIIVLLFGARKLPELARGGGQALRIFKEETKKDPIDAAKDEALRELDDKQAELDAERKKMLGEA
jgi:sec-independent protein translocase protein TatA